MCRGKLREVIGVGNTSLNRPLIAQQIRTRIGKWDCINLKKLLHSKGKQLPVLRENLHNGRKSLPAIHWIKINIQNI
jgi:hypothetical protein